MKKTLIAAALFAGFAGAAHAQSSVTLYGIVDAGLRYEKVDGAKSKVGVDSGNAAQSRWGIRGVEDLGNGLKAVFTLESAINVDDGDMPGNGRLFQREATVGLSSNTAGEVRLGRQTNLAFRWVNGLGNAFGLGYGGGKTTNFFSSGHANFGSNRPDNAIYYVSPNFSGFQFGAGYSFQVNGTGTEGSSEANRMFDIGLRYAAGPLAVAASYQQTDLGSADALVATTGDPKNFQVAASYDFGVVKAHLGYGNAKNLTAPDGRPSPNGRKVETYTVGLSAPVGAGRVLAAYNHAEHKNVQGFASAQNRDGFQVGYTYDLSKRTQFYSFLGKGFYTYGNPNRDAKELALGLRHSF